MPLTLQAYEDGDGPVDRPLARPPAVQPGGREASSASLKGGDGDESDEDTYEDGGVSDGCAARPLPLSSVCPIWHALQCRMLTPDTLCFSKCKAMLELNGEYTRTAEFDAFLDKKRPVYQRTCSISASGDSSTVTVFCFHWHFSKMCSGWWLGPKFGSQEEVYGHCPSASSTPPVKGWQIRSHGRRQHDPARFTVGSADTPAATLPSVEEAIASLDVRTLMGSVRARSQGAAAYFGHFNCLLHLEYLTEVTALRRRFTSRDGASLQKFGWCLMGLPVSHASTQRARRSSRGGTDGEPPSCKVTLKLDGGISFDRLRFKRGDSIILSETDPLIDKVADGSLVRSFWEQTMRFSAWNELSRRVWFDAVAYRSFFWQVDLVPSAAVLVLEGISLPPDFEKKTCAAAPSGKQLSAWLFMIWVQVSAG
jgi:hypothetical protein